MTGETGRVPGTIPVSRRDFAKIAIAAAVAPTLPAGWPAPAAAGLVPPEPVRVAPAWPGYERAIVIDALASPGPFNVPERTARPLSAAMLANARASGITAVNVTVNTGGADAHGSFVATVRELGYWARELAAHPETLVQVRSAADVREAKRSGRLGLVFGFQDADLLESDVARLGVFHDFGVRVIQLTYNLRNPLGDGCLQKDNAGLTSFGREVVGRMNELGLLVDLSHCGQRTTAEAITASAAPVAITHTGCDALYPHPRNKRDAELRAMADRGGVVGIYMMPFLNAEGPAQIDDFLEHLEHAIRVCGEDHVGVGSDNSITPTVADDTYRRTLRAFADERARLGIGAPREHEVLFVEGLNEPRRMETLADRLLERGHTETRVEKVLGGNWLRLWTDVWRA